MAATGTQAASDAAATTSCQSWSRPGVRGAEGNGVPLAVEPVRWRITQCSGLWVAASMARSSSGLYSITRWTSMPQLADTITFGRASSMRIASSWGAKPPNLSLIHI